MNCMYICVEYIHLQCINLYTITNIHSLYPDIMPVVGRVWVVDTGAAILIDIWNGNVSMME